MQTVTIPLPLDRLGYLYRCEECGCLIHISEYDNDLPEWPKTTYHNCPNWNCPVEIKHIWVLRWRWENDREREQEESELEPFLW